mgnify:CR=1 FL=1|tara:strand:- start:979 stop:1542 length:564 start_codon:yes stop_codon:yes gene_type:complete
MRIIGGKLKGSLLFNTKDKDTRPLKDITKESIFNLLMHSNKIGFKIEEASVLDLYSGTGSFGLECLSRQAKNVSFIEKEQKALKILKKNIEKLKLKKKTKVFSSDVIKLMEKQNIFTSKFDLIFCDPPFKSKNVESLIQLIFFLKLLKEKGVFIIHRNKNFKDVFPDYFKIIDVRNYGVSKIIFGKF